MTATAEIGHEGFLTCTGLLVNVVALILETMIRSLVDQLLVAWPLFNDEFGVGNGQGSGDWLWLGFLSSGFWIYTR